MAQPIFKGQGNVKAKTEIVIDDCLSPQKVTLRRGTFLDRYVEIEIDGRKVFVNPHTIFHAVAALVHPKSLCLCASVVKK